MIKKTLFCVAFLLLVQLGFSQTSSAVQTQAFGQDLIQGLEAYRVGDWDDALFFLKRTDDFQDATSDSIWFFVIMAEINLGDYSAALRDGTTFLQVFSKSSYVPEITYQTLFASYELDMYENAIQGLTKFTETYPNHNYTSLAIFYTGEALYNVFEYDRAKSMYNRVINDFPRSIKYDDSLFRLELLEQREREEKLLYLLRVTGEEAVAAKEDYERQLKLLEGEESILLRKRLEELESINNKLSVQQQDLLAQNESLKRQLSEYQSVEAVPIVPVQVPVEVPYTDQTSDTTNQLIDDLLRKAEQLQQLVDEK